MSTPDREVLIARNGPSGVERTIVDPLGKMEDGSAAVDSAKARWKIRDIKTLQTLADSVDADVNAKIAWSLDGRGFYFEDRLSLSPSQIILRTFYHLVSSRKGHDRVAFSFYTDGNAVNVSAITSDGRQLVTTITYGTQQAPLIFYRRLPLRDSPTVELFAGRNTSRVFIGSTRGELLFLRTDGACPNSCVEGVDPANSKRERLVVRDAGRNIESASIVSNYLFLLYTTDAHSSVVEFDASGRTLRTLVLPEIGTVDPGSFDDDGTGRYLSVLFSNYVTPPTRIDFDIQTGKRTIVGSSRINYDPREFATEQHFFSSLDGTRVPMYITHRRDASLNRANPTILYVYGGFGASQLPVWTPEIVSWLSMGGIYAVVNARGGGEYGDSWHRAGTVLNKQRSVDDTFAAARELIKSAYADSEHLAIRGDSNGALVAADAAIQHPELFHAIITREGLLDLVRYDDIYHGDVWKDEFGSKDADLSPVAEERSGVSYPAALIQTGDQDSVVSPAHSYKFVAALQAAQADANPVLLRIDHGVGHHGGETYSQIIDESVDQYSFLLNLMDVRNLHN